MRLLSGVAGIAQAVELIHQGECVALPTETVYGLAADAANESAVAKIFEAKGRPKNHPLIVHIASAEHLDQWARDIPPQARMLANACWPGPLTLLLKRSASTPKVVTGGLDSIGIRVPSHPVFLSVLERVGTGLAAPSANRYKALSPTSASQVVDGLRGYIPAVLEGGACEFGLESTIVDFTTKVPRIVRAGPFGKQDLEAITGSGIETPQEHDAIVPGNVQAHYQPRTPLQLFSQNTVGFLDALKENSGFLCYSPQIESQLKKAAAQQGIPANRIMVLPQHAAGYGQQLYASLHALDQLGLKNLLLEQPPTGDDWMAVNDRLNRAIG